MSGLKEKIGKKSVEISKSRNLQLSVEVDPTFLNVIEELAYIHAELGNLHQAKSTLSIGLLNVPNRAFGY